MPYAKNQDLPDQVRNVLPEHAQDIYRGAFNSAWDTYSDQTQERREETAHRVAWAAVKRRYRKAGGQWVARDD